MITTSRWTNSRYVSVGMVVASQVGPHNRINNVISTLKFSGCQHSQISCAAFRRL